MSTKKLKIIENNFEVNDRLDEALRTLKLRQADVVNMTGCSRGLLSNLLNKKRPVSDKFMRAMNDYVGISASWLKTGNGEMLVGKSEDDKPERESTEAGRRAEEIVNSLSYENQYLAIQILTRLKESEKVVANTH